MLLLLCLGLLVDMVVAVVAVAADLALVVLAALVLLLQGLPEMLESLQLPRRHRAPSEAESAGWRPAGLAAEVVDSVVLWGIVARVARVVEVAAARLETRSTCTRP